MGREAGSFATWLWGRALAGFSIRSPLPLPLAPLEAAQAEKALHLKRLLITLAIAAAIAGLEAFAPPGLWVQWVSLGLAAMALALAGEVVQNSLHTLSRARLNGDSIVALGALGALLGGFAATTLMALGRLSPVALGGVESGSLVTTLGLEMAALLLVLPHLGRYLEARGKARAAQNIVKLRALRPASARVLDRSGEVESPLERVGVGQRVGVGPGERIPVDGVIVETGGTVDESILGAEEPVPKGPEGRVYAGTLNMGEPLVVQVRRPGGDCAWHDALDLALQAQATPTPRTAAEVWATSILSALSVTTAALLWTTLWSEGRGYGAAARAALGVLAAAWPGPLVLAAQAAAQAAMALLVRSGLVVRNMASLSRLARAKVVFFAKSGVLTYGQPEVAEVMPVKAGIQAEEILFLAMVLEFRSEHPIAEGIRRASGAPMRTVKDLRGFRPIPQKGLRGQHQGKELVFGSIQLLIEAGIDVTQALPAHSSMAERGLTPLVLAWGREVLGLVGMEDEERPEAREVAQEMRRMGLKCAILSGDCRGTVMEIARRLGLDEARGELSFSRRAEAVREQVAKGEMVLAIGHGLADATVLATADVGIALQAADDLGIDSAAALVLGSDLRGASRLVRQARAAAARGRRVLVGLLPLSLLALSAAAVLPALGRPFSPAWAALAAALSTLAAATLAGRARERRSRTTRTARARGADAKAAPGM